MLKKICVFSFSLVLIFSMFFSSYCADLNELQTQRAEIQSQINETSEELKSVNDELTQNLQEIQSLDDNISQNELELQNLNKKVTELESKIKNTEKELSEITQKYNIQKGLLDSRLVAMYESEDVNFLDVMLGSNSIGDFISSYYLISEITSYDTDLLELVENEKKQIEQISSDLNQRKEELRQEQQEFSKKQIALSNTKLLRENHISKLSEEEKILQNKIDEYNNQVRQIETEIRSLVGIANFGESYAGGPMQWPIYGHYNITSNFGMRVHPITGVYKLHTGVDIGASMGTDFTAIANGVVVKAEYNSAYGNMVIIDHGGGVQTLYAHGSQIVAMLGQTVNAGDVILKVGSTGYSTGPHAHFEVRVNGEPVNPLDYVQKPE